MNQVRVGVIAGSGRLMRSGSVIAFSRSPSTELWSLVGQPGGDLFERLAALVAARPPDLAPFAVVDLRGPAAFVFGPVEVRSGPVVVSADNGLTWSHGPLSAGPASPAGGLS